MDINAFAKYKTAAVKTSDTVGQMLFVFDEIIKLLHIAKKATLEKNYDQKYKTLIKITDIFMTLRGGVDTSFGEVIVKLDRFYETTLRELYRINTGKTDPENITIVINTVQQVRNAIQDAQESENKSCEA